MNKTKSSRLQRARLVVQIAAVALTVFGYFALIRNFGMPQWLFLGTVVIAGLFFCGWACPFGSAQEWLRLFGKKVLGVNLNIPAKVNRYLSFSRYVVPAIGALFALSFLDSRRAFITLLTGNAVMIGALVFLAALLLLSLAVDRPYCRFICKFGALTGTMSMARIFGVKRSASTCVDCQACERACIMGVEVSLAHTVRDPHCINCGKCVSACPVPDTLTIGFALPAKADAIALKEKYIPSIPAKEKKEDL